jgi:hypothetical protein
MYPVVANMLMQPCTLAAVLRWIQDAMIRRVEEAHWCLDAEFRLRLPQGRDSEGTQSPFAEPESPFQKEHIKNPDTSQTAICQL